MKAFIIIFLELKNEKKKAKELFNFRKKNVYSQNGSVSKQFLK